MSGSLARARRWAHLRDTTWGVCAGVDQVRQALDAVVLVFSDPLTAGGAVVGAVVLGAGAWWAARRFGWKPVPAAFGGSSSVSWWP